VGQIRVAVGASRDYIRKDEGEKKIMIENRILQGDSLAILKTLPDQSVDCCVTSPPYFNLRMYGDIDGVIGNEDTPEEYIGRLLAVFHEVRRVLKDSGTCWVNIGDTYNGSGKNNGNTKPLSAKQMSNTASHAVKALSLKTIPLKSLAGIPWRFALAMVDTGWTLRQDIIWAKPSCMPESVKDRFCKSHEYLFFFAKDKNYYFNHEAALEPAAGYDGKDDTCRKARGYSTKNDKTGLAPQYHGTNIRTYPMRLKRDVWTVATESSSENHYAMFPQKLIEPCILCGCPQNGIVLDPFIGSGTAAVAAKKLMRKYIGCEINSEYIEIAERRIAEIDPLFDGKERHEASI
jgi:DNA modification methylase